MTPYDNWILRGPDGPHEIGTEEGETCGRYHEPDEDAPRGYKPQPCNGVMILEPVEDTVICDTCGESDTALDQIGST